MTVQSRTQQPNDKREERRRHNISVDAVCSRYPSCPMVYGHNSRDRAIPSSFGLPFSVCSRVQRLSQRVFLHEHILEVRRRALELECLKDMVPRRLGGHRRYTMRLGCMYVCRRGRYRWVRCTGVIRRRYGTRIRVWLGRLREDGGVIREGMRCEWVERRGNDFGHCVRRR